MSKLGNTAQTPLFPELRGRPREPGIGDRFVRGQVEIHFDRAENLYASWQRPTCIISDGPYGVSGYPGDNHRAETLADWYEPHIKEPLIYSPPQEDNGSQKRRQGVE